MERAREADRLLLGFVIHASLWILAALAVVGLGRRALFPGRPILTWILAAGLVGLVVSLWATRRTRGLALGLLSALSFLGLVLVLTETVAARIRPVELSVTRYPYPYRMHGAAPALRGGDNHMGMTTNDAGLRDGETVPRKPSGELRVVVLGGSAILGAGNADDETVPHWLEGLLAARLERAPLVGIDSVRVINAGQGYYNSTQELVFLMTELALYEPDVIVVADGYNDLHHALVWGDRPPANEVTGAMLEDLLHRGGAVRRIEWADALYTAVRASYLGNRTRGGLAASIVSPPDLGVVAGPLRGPKQDPQFLPLVQHRLIMNWTLMHRLSQAFGARAIFSLQPTIFVKDPLSPEEREYVRSAGYGRLVSEGWRELERTVAAEVQRLGLPAFQADRHVRSQPDRVFFDYCHMTSEGNRLMAQAMLERIEEALADWPARAAWDGVRFTGEAGDPIWRPERLTSPGRWR